MNAPLPHVHPSEGPYTTVIIHIVNRGDRNDDIKTIVSEWQVITARQLIVDYRSHQDAHALARTWIYLPMKRYPRDLLLKIDKHKTLGTETSNREDSGCRLKWA